MSSEESTGQDKKEPLKYFKVAESSCGCHDSPQLHVLGIFVNGGMLPDTLYRAIADIFSSECVQLPDGPYAAFVNAPDGKKTDTEDFGTIDRNLINSLMLKTEDQRKEEKQQEAQSREEQERDIMLSIKTWRKMHNLREQDPEPNNENNRNNKQVDIELDQTEVRMMEGRSESYKLDDGWCAAGSCTRSSSLRQSRSSSPRINAAQIHAT